MTAVALFLASGAAAEHPNEPAGFTKITERAFSAKEEDGWTESGDSRYTIETDATAPQSPSNVGRMRFQAGFTGGVPPGRTSKEGWANSHVYLHFWYKFSSGWQGHDSTINKIGFLTDASTGGGGDPLAITVRGKDSNTLTIRVTIQNSDPEVTTTNFDWNTGGNGVAPTEAQAEIVRGSWHDIEIEFKADTPGSSNAEIHLWNNGVKILQFTGLKMVHAGADGNFDSLRWQPIWGGVDDTVVTEQFNYMDHAYMSGS